MSRSFKINQEKSFFDNASDELQDVIGQPPPGVVRWGMTAFFSVLVILLFVSLFVKYAETVSGNFTLTSTNSPKPVTSKMDGKIQRLFIVENQSVIQGETVAWIESIASHEDVIRLSIEMDSMWKSVKADNWNQLLTHTPSSFKKLGELQNAYHDFASEFVRLSAYLKNGVFTKKKKLLDQEVGYLSELKKTFLEQERIYKEDYNLAQEDFKAQQMLYNEKIIASLEYRQEESRYINKRLPIENIRSALINNENEIALKQQELVLLQQQYGDEKSEFLQSLNTLISAIDDWKRKYLLMAPISGKVSWQIPLQEKQDVLASRELLYIAPDSPTYYGEVRVPQQNFGKIKLGQQVLISLNGYPYQEFGKLMGEVYFVSTIPDKDKLYYVGVKFRDGLKTDISDSIKYTNGLIGTAEIITKKKRLINKFLYTIREIIYKPKKEAST
jgi:multidrug resistance efflux pump